MTHKPQGPTSEGGPAKIQRINSSPPQALGGPGAMIALALLLLSDANYLIEPTQAQQAAAFPGVTRDLASFCSARPSLSIDLAPMIVHVKRNTSFNYKLYLFSADEHVFQTGQVVPRDDFRVHSFPVKLKHLNEFMPSSGQAIEVYQLQDSSGPQGEPRNSNQHLELKRVSSSSFNPRQFFSLVPLNPASDHDGTASRKGEKFLHEKRARSLDQPQAGRATGGPSRKSKHKTLPFDVHGDVLPGDESFAHHDVALADDGGTESSEENVNERVQFDRDDQVAVLGAPGAPERRARELGESARLESRSDQQDDERRPLGRAHDQQQSMVMPVGSFSSFHVNLTYLVRKDFGQSEAQLVRVQVDAQQFRATRVHLLSGFARFAPLPSDGAGPGPTTTNHTRPEDETAELANAEDYAFLSHKLLRDTSTRIVSVTQIYEDWITRNFYTIVYIQRRLVHGELVDVPAGSEISPQDQELRGLRSSTSGGGGRKGGGGGGELVTDRLIFRGSSTQLLGATQLEYHVKASAFITEKNGLHYFLEFLPSGKFYLGAIDWSRRPFKFIDSQQFAIKQTRTLFDNEELLLCPPSVCYSEQPVDEIVSYGRLGSLSEKLQREALILARSTTGGSGGHGPGAERTEVGAQGKRVLTLLTTDLPTRAPEHDDHELLLLPKAERLERHHNLQARQAAAAAALVTTSHQSESISLDALIEAVRAGAGRLETRLHLRDWVWSLPRVGLPAGSAAQTSQLKTSTRPAPTATTNRTNSTASQTSRFTWHFEWARRNEMKVTQDTYGFALTGHEIDASYRVFNELYLISANQLITINYTLPNETVTSVHPIEEEFSGLSSTLLDPITGAFYDRYSNQIFFFKGDRYVGFDFATKKPLEDFLLPSGVDFLGLTQAQAQFPFPAPQGAGGGTRLAVPAGNNKQQRPLLSSLPVVGILGRQHSVDAIYHDLHDDIVFVFSGMKFYTHQASDFKDGAFRTPGGREPTMRCINEHFFAGCRFDEAYPNPCRDEQAEEGEDEEAAAGERGAQQPTGRANAKLVDASGQTKEQRPRVNSTGHTMANFNEEQQMKLRSIAARGGGLVDFLLENTLLAQGATRAIEPFLAAGGEPVHKDGSFVMLTQTATNAQERIVIYLLVAMVLITIMVTVAMIIVILNWAHVGRRGDSGDASSSNSDDGLKGDLEQHLPPIDASQAQILRERIAYPPAISQYLNNQYHHQQQQQQQQLHHQQQQFADRHQRPGRNFYLGQRPQVGVGLAPRRSSQSPLPPPPTGPKPATRIPFKSYITSGGRDPDTIVDSSAL